MAKINIMVNNGFFLFIKELSFIFYKFRHAIIYTAIGFFSIYASWL